MPNLVLILSSEISNINITGLARLQFRFRSHAVWWTFFSALVHAFCLFFSFQQFNASCVLVQFAKFTQIFNPNQLFFLYSIMQEHFFTKVWTLKIWTREKSVNMWKKVDKVCREKFYSLMTSIILLRWFYQWRIIFKAQLLQQMRGH